MATAPIADSWGFHVRKSDLLYGLATVQSIQAIQSVQTIQSVKGWRQVGGCPIPSYGLKKLLKYIGVLYLSFWRLENRIKQVTDTTKHTTNILVSDLQTLDSSWNLIRRLANKSQGSGLNTENIQHVAGVVVISWKSTGILFDWNQGSRSNWTASLASHSGAGKDQKLQFPDVSRS